MHESWKALLADEFKKPYFSVLKSLVQDERETHAVYPLPGDTFNAFRTPYDRANVLILGQDPYHGSGQAHGLSFSVKPGTDVPPSLRNIFRELKTDLGIPVPNHGHLQKWADQGVLLLNSTLTVRQGSPGSHHGFGWERFTDRVIRLLNDRSQPVVFVLWGAFARAKKELITGPGHTVIESAHPSPLSASGFLGTKPFSAINAALQKNGQPPIDWRLESV